jgi:Trp operon repressor
MDTDAERVIDAANELLEANRAAREVMEHAETVLVGGIERLKAGESITNALRALPTSDQRQSTQEAMERLTVARHQVRLLVIAACLKEDMTPREIADQWGISRQRADRFVQEIRKGPADGPHT